MSFKPQVIDGGKGQQGQFVCPWCGSTFARRHVASDGVLSLEEHWQTNPRCKALASVNNPLQTKYGDADAAPSVAGEYTINRVRGPECSHPEALRSILYATNGQGGWTDEIIGWQCGNCYGAFR